ncbi:sugar transferase [Dinghuibacter silviterrae]|uniref:Lipopolysaccharide/colanic/teichoic acid biosynthesis glycosyltransferase n=1 Tax=Dinghuibacter silviterrae TaxID=1539049 RepID=A0A4R8DF17_9BACT|nr:sugar transferase [Dinghuibacter silviterrae]TDW95878.1 lipopolysaccharide/colanic/teichoic acid biosynthesis glycosyltransferase [Dinghuibacter silviterrae]
MKTFALGVVKAPILKPKGPQGTRFLDLFMASLGLILAAPIMLVVALLIKLSDKGPVLYKQVRVGQGGKPFTIFKFRSMRLDAEQNGPALAKKDDPRTTKIGNVLRKWRLDELPQLWNVLKGDMAMVGPRPERQYYIDRIMDHAPNYGRLLELKPGLTSMGIVRFGYASSVEEMIDRQRHDQYYLENRSIALDLRILVQSVQVVLGRKGK